MKEKWHVETYPLTIWCVNCGLIGIGKPKMYGLTFEECEGTIIWMDKSLECGTVSITDEKGHAYFLCPNCKDKFNNRILFRDVRFPFPMWRYNIRVDPTWVDQQDRTIAFVPYKMIEYIVKQYFNEIYFCKIGLDFNLETGYAYLVD